MPWRLRRDVDRLGGRLDTVERRLDAIEQDAGHRLDALETALGELRRALDRAAETADGRLDRLESGVAAASGEIERLRDHVVPSVVARSDALLDRVADEVEEVGSLVERMLRDEPLPVPSVDAAERAFAAELARVQPLLLEAFRGSEAEIRSRLDRWLPELRGHEPVLDLGCGRGELLLMLCDAGVEAEGVDGDPALVQAARRRGLAVVEGDVLEVLRGRADASAGAITALHLAEHLEPTTLLAVLAEARRVLRPGGVLLVESPDPTTLRVGAALFWLDPTHRRPLLAETLELFLRATGFEVVRTERLHPFPESERVGAGAPELPAGRHEGGVAELAARLRSIEGRLDALLNGPRDFAVVARRPPE
jgi:O-antigen chain-terminating methyltransferase